MGNGSKDAGSAGWWSGPTRVIGGLTALILAATGLWAAIDNSGFWGFFERWFPQTISVEELAGEYKMSSPSGGSCQDTYNQDPVDPVIALGPDNTLTAYNECKQPARVKIQGSDIIFSGWSNRDIKARVHKDPKTGRIKITDESNNIWESLATTSSGRAG
jgi:hypothetical protein